MTAIEGWLAGYPSTWDDAYADYREIGCDHATAMVRIRKRFKLVGGTNPLLDRDLGHCLRGAWEEEQQAMDAGRNLQRDLLLGLVAALAIIVACYVGVSL